jgi:hypothetical protein
MGSFEALPLTRESVRSRRATAPVPYPQLVFGVWGPYIAGYGWTANPLGFTAPMRRQGYA